VETCFVVMGFGVKTDYQTGRKLDLDKSYQNVIKPAVEAAGLKCVRADEIQHAGVIDKPMYEQLLQADLVVADVSTMNPNAFYELGVRHALRPHTTIIMAESELAFPFDINHNAIRRYKHLGEDIGASEARRAMQDLTAAIRAIQNAPQADSPVYTYLQNLAPPHLPEEAPAPGDMPVPAAMAAPPQAFQGEGTGDGNANSVGMLLDQAKKAREKGEWGVAAFLLSQLKEGMEKGTGNGALDPYILQQLALATYKSDNTEPGLRKACDLLETLHPETSKDPETLGLWGAIHKRLWEVTGDRITLDKALRAYEIGFTVRNDYYTGVNFALMLNIRASATDGDDAVADRVMAKRVRQRVIASCDDLLKEELTTADRYWALATQAEAYFGIGQLEQSRLKLADAVAIVPEPWMLKSTKEQIQKLGVLLGIADLPWAAKAEAAG
jgi:nucleoside 2-deoxyribosyltransferase